MSDSAEQVSWVTTIREFSIGDVELLQQWVRANPESVVTGLLCFLKDKHRGPSNQPQAGDFLHLWGEMAEKMHRGVDVVAELRSASAHQNWKTITLT
jgi:hypothetical protein